MVTVKCLGCDTDNDPRETGGYCDACGKKLPTYANLRPRRVPGGEANSVASVEATPPRGRQRAAETLFTVAVVRLILGGLALVVGPMVLTRVPEAYLPGVMVATVGSTAAYAVLGLLARSLPRLAGLLALVVFAGGLTAGLVLAPGAAPWGLPLDGVVLVLLIRALRQGFRDRTDR